MNVVQAVVTGMLLGGLYAVMSVGLSVSWGMLRVINLAHFGMILLGAYLTFELATEWGVNPILTLVVTVPAMAALGAALQWVYERTGLAEFTSLLVSFGVMIIMIQAVQNIWTADFQRMGADVNPFRTRSLTVAGLALPLPTLIAFGAGAALIVAGWAVLRSTFTGRAVRAIAEDRVVAAAYGVDDRRLGMVVAAACGASAAVAGMLWALYYTLVPDAPFEWIGIVFAVVILGGVGQVLGTLGAGVLVGALTSLVSLVWESRASLIVVFAVIILTLLVRPHGLFTPREAR
ncbi:MAG: branched-chain amino acid ABC transporter permease [Micromonosporaceae bacterium]|jgi:branched-chain amino acid transport system permease protein